jgi:hypothetical protein
MGNRSQVPYGTLNLMVLKTLDTLGPQHGYGIARRIEQVAEGSLALNQKRLAQRRVALHEGAIPRASSSLESSSEGPARFSPLAPSRV